MAKKSNGILLSSKVQESEKIIPPRPVYSDELNLFGFNKFIDYNNSNSPQLWAIGRKYFYKGNHIATLKGGDIFNKPELIILKKVKIKPVDLEELIEINKKSLIILENESKKFIHNIYLKNKKKYTLGVAFSGGKDSQVLLELVSQVIPPDEYFTIFTDTQMELPPTYKTIEKTKAFYREKYDHFNIFTAEQNQPILKNWKNFGSPSRLQRWCCTVCKTSPYLNLIKQLNPGNKPVVVYEGVRGEESNKRMTYERVAYGKKHNSITNARPIFHWNLSEIHMYLFYRNIEINPAYKYGLSRVGCIVCPFSSEWSEYLVNKLYPNETKKFIDIIYESLPVIGINNVDKQNEYIKKGHWKKRAGGKSLLPLDCSCDIVDSKEQIKIDIINPKSDLFEWLKILNPKIKKIEHETYSCNVIYKKNYFDIDIFIRPYGYHIQYIKKSNDQIFASILKKIIYKATYCGRCGACTAECPTGAISFLPSIKIDSKKCINCLKCITFVDKGCLLAKSRHGVIGGSIMTENNKNLDRYSTFGLREEWLVKFVNNPSNWKNGLGSKQVPAFRRWLIESEIIDNKNELRKIFYILQKKSIKDIWSIIWVNLCMNSPIVKWYSNLDFKLWERTEIQEAIFSQYPQYSEGTLKNPISALLNTFDNSVYLSNKLNLGILYKKGRSIKSIEKKGTNEINPVILLYCLYKYAEKNEYFDFTLSELYEKNMELTPYRIFGIEKEYLANILRGLQESKYKFIRVEFAANLDNIFLNNEYTSIEILEILLEEKSQ